MDLGAVGLDGFVGSDSSGFAPSDPETTKHNKWYGSGFLKQERSSTTPDHSRTFKLSKTLNDDISASRAMLRSNANATLFPHEPQMLSFSSQKSEPLFLDNNNKTLQYSHHTLSSYSRTISGNMQGMGRGAFTPSQWMELEHQALIYKYLTANLPVPPHLLIPIKKALESAAFCNALLRPNHPMGWGGFHLGLSSSTDPEPGRCRRTDGKKWRCSRDAVVDQKYCERHMNRGRHRSRKPVEGHNGHGTTTPTTATATTTTTTTSSKQLPNNNNTLSFAQLQPNNIMHPPLASDTSAAPNRMIMNNKENGSDTNALAMLPPTLELKPKENPFVIHKQQIPYEESSRNEFGLVTSDSLLNPSHKNTTLLSNRTFSSSQTKQDTDSQRSLRQFIDDWPKTQSHQHRSWPELDMQSERTELSISIPMTSSDFMSSASSLTNEKVTLSPLRLSRELDPIQMGLGVGNGINESSNTSRQANWIPISWESSMGGPLGEVLNLSNNNNNNTSENCAKNNSALNLLSDGWDNSPPLGSSPTGVLQKTVFGSLSNSSAGSSPRADNNSSSLPAL